ncbi:MAG: transglutaminase family protein [Gammaproteobacteria bacterium]|nr:transglutaminase family protein [Gammaproteobacteria bacterium]
MHFNINHRTTYRYAQAVRLGPQQLRFYPRQDGAQRVIRYQLKVTPTPTGNNEHIDLEGNRVTQVWFEGETEQLDIQVEMEVATLRRNAFDFILAVGADQLPMQHAQDHHAVQAYLQRIEPDDAVTAFAAEMSLAVERQTLQFLDRLNRQIFNDYELIHRETGAPQIPAYTLHNRRGACRDLTVLFVDCCRAEGIPARFASGYQKGDLHSERRHLHAWPEVYLPGAGWRGYDPTHGEAVADQHVTIAAAADPANTMPVSGGFSGAGVSSKLDYKVDIQVTE